MDTKYMSMSMNNFLRITFLSLSVLAYYNVHNRPNSLMNVFEGFLKSLFTK